MKNATPKLPLFSFFMFLFEKMPIRPRTSFLSGQKMPPLPGLLAGLPYLQSRKKRRKPLQLIFLRFTYRLRIWPRVTDESKKSTGTTGHLSIFWLGWRDSNPRMRESKSRALPLGDNPAKTPCLRRDDIEKSELFRIRFFSGVASGIRTHGLQSHNLAR